MKRRPSPGDGLAAAWLLARLPPAGAPLRTTHLVETRLHILLSYTGPDVRTEYVALCGA